jgi:hypothetical protein
MKKHLGYITNGPADGNEQQQSDTKTTIQAPYNEGDNK